MFFNLKPHKHIALHQIHKIMFFLATSYDPFKTIGSPFTHRRRVNQLQGKGPCILSLKFSYVFFRFFFSYSSSFLIKMLATDAKTQKIEPDPIFFFLRRMKVLDAVCKRD